MSYELAVMDEQSDHIIWRMDEPVEMPWASQFRETMYEVFFSTPEKQGRVCFVGNTYGYLL